MVEEKPMGMGASKIGKALESSPDLETDVDEDDASEEEVMAFKAFKGAGSPEEGATALKNFIKICGGY